MDEQIVILDFGSQYTQVIARRIRECSVYSTILPYNTPAREIKKLAPRGIILSGGPSSAYAKDAPLPDKKIFGLGVPVYCLKSSSLEPSFPLVCQFVIGNFERLPLRRSVRHIDVSAVTFLFGCTAELFHGCKVLTSLGGIVEVRNNTIRCCDSISRSLIEESSLRVFPAYTGKTGVL